jgi:C4-dicarboxylate-specific signal transduction histidine kinase
MNKIGVAALLCALSSAPAFACNYDAIVAEIDQGISQAKSEPAGCAQDQAVSEAIMAGADKLIGECPEDQRAQKKLEELNDQVEAADAAAMKNCK